MAGTHIRLGPLEIHRMELSRVVDGVLVARRSVAWGDKL
jgi:hypothetical protein